MGDSTSNATTEKAAAAAAAVVAFGVHGAITPWIREWHNRQVLVATVELQQGSLMAEQVSARCRHPSVG